MSSPFITGYATAIFLDNSKIREMCDDILRQRMAREENEVRRMLGFWVSGLDPAIARGPDGALLGLTQAGALIGTQMQIIVPAWGEA